MKFLTFVEVLDFGKKRKQGESDSTRMLLFRILFLKNNEHVDCNCLVEGMICVKLTTPDSTRSQPVSK